MSDLVDRLAELITEDNAVLFVGTGLRQGPDQPPTAQQIADALAERIGYQRPDRSLAAVARDFEVLKGRNALILAIREELEKLEGQPAPVHQLIADAVLPKTKVISSRFDQVLERALEQFRKPYVLIVRDTDVPFFDETKVTLIKVLGDISQPDSLVITEDDIRDFISKLPTVSDVVKAFFATKTMVFLGYDLNSQHFKNFFREVTRNLSAFQRRAYAIVPQPLDDVERRYWEKQNVEICPYDPLEFLEALTEAVKTAAQQPERADPNPLRHLAEHPLPPRPYKALDSFTGTDVAIFAGRTEDSQRLTNRVLAHRLTVLYGESGSGKTSLLQAGVGPRLADRRSLLATCVPAPGQPLAELVHRSLVKAGQSAGLPELADDDLVPIIREWQNVLNGPIVLAVDQVEQFFVAYGLEERRAAASFLNSLRDDRSLDLRLVFVSREDFLGQLQTLEEQLHGLLDVRFRLERLGREEAREAIEEPARLFGAMWEPALVETLLDDLYASAEGGVAPPQLQIVCDRLYTEVVEQADDSAGKNGVQITLDQFRKLGGTEAILGRYLSQTVQEFSSEQQPTVRALLGALVSSSGVKQRLALDDVARAADVNSTKAAEILDELTRQRLVRRYEVTVESADGPLLEYELTHDYLVPRIAHWLGDEFWDAQKAREILRQAVPEWESRSRLLAPDDLRLVAAQRGVLRLSDAEVETLYATAVAYAEDAGGWQALLSDEACRRILLRLVEHAQAFARRQAARQLAVFPGEDASAALVEKTLSDPDEGVREAAARAIAESAGSDGQAVDPRAMKRIVDATDDLDTADAARQALVTIRDLQPASEGLLPADLRSRIRRQVWSSRWRRNWQEILMTTLRGAQGGFWGLGLGMGLFFGLYSAISRGFDRINWQSAVSLMSAGIPLAGAIGVLAVGGGAFVRAALQSLQDQEELLRTWVVTAVVSAILFTLGLLFLGAISFGELEVVRTTVAGLLLGLALAGAATAPLKLVAPLRLVLAAAVGIAIFALVGRLGLFFGRSSWWLLVMGGASGIGFFMGMNRDLER